MKRIYLDQNKWIDLARAATGHPLGEPFRDVLDVALHSVERGDVSFPLDLARYIETHKRKDARSRHAVGETMYRLSRMHTLAPPPVVLPVEIDVAIDRRFSVNVPPRRAQIFGVGIEHATGGSVTAEVPIELPEGSRQRRASWPLCRLCAGHSWNGPCSGQCAERSSPLLRPTSRRRWRAHR